MHMADALVSPAVGATLWIGAAGLSGLAARGLASERLNQAPMMGVLGAFVFAAQMLNFAIPGTGSSGHIGGGLLLAILLGPRAAYVVMGSILAAQALLFADGGLLALGANVINLGALTCFVAYPLVYVPLAGSQPGSKRAFLATLAAAIVGLQLGSLGVVIETVSSQISELPLITFLTFMQPVHLVIGAFEGIATFAVVMTLHKARPELFLPTARNSSREPGSTRKSSPRVLAILTAIALVGGALSWMASSRPDGLEWALEHTGYAPLPPTAASPLHRGLSGLQERTSILPDYALPSSTHPAVAGSSEPGNAALSGFVGILAVFALAGGIGWALSRRRVFVSRSNPAGPR